MYVYSITNTINGKKYVGVTARDIQLRLNEHKRRAMLEPVTVLQHAMVKYGIDCWHIEVLEDGFDDIDSLFLAERRWIADVNPEYNMTAGGDGGDTSHSPKYRVGIAMRDQTGPRNPMYGKAHSDSTKSRISSSKTGVSQTPVHREKTRAALLANRPTAEDYAKGAEKRAKWWEVDTPEGDTIIVKNLSKFCRERGLDQGNLCNTASGRLKTHKGYTARRVA